MGEMSIQNQHNSDYQELIHQVGMDLEKGRQQVVTAVNNTMVQTYWMIGQHIVEYEQKGHEKAEYGSGLLDRLSEDLSRQYGNGFGRSNVFSMRRFYLLYPKIQTVSGFLSWSHYIELLKIDDPLERSFYEKEAENSHWGVRELKRQMKSMHYAMQNISNQLFVSRYQLYLPDREQLETEFHRFMGGNADK